MLFLTSGKKEKKIVITSLSLFIWIPDAKYLTFFFFYQSFENLDIRVTGRENFQIVLNTYIHPEKKCFVLLFYYFF